MQEKRKQKTTDDLQDYVFGKVQPQARDLEEAILGALMLEKESFTNIESLIRPEMFYLSQHKEIFKAIARLNERNAPIDILTVTQELRAAGELDNCGGAFYISELTNRVVSAANIVYHSRIVQQKYLSRELIRISSELLRDGYEDTTDIFELLTTAEGKITNLSNGVSDEVSSDIDSYIVEANEWIKNSREKKGMAGEPTGIEILDRAMGGYTPGELITIAARPGMGKTAFALTCARNQAMKFGLPIGFISLEMVGRELVVRMLAAAAEVNGERIKRGLTDDEQFKKLQVVSLSMSNAKIYINDRSDMTARKVRRWAKLMKIRYGIRLLYLDYLQILTDEDEKKSREQQVSANARAMKKLAKELNIPVIQLAQLGRSVEENKNSIPKLSDLRESGAIEQDSDVVLFLYRPEEYGYKRDSEGNSLANFCQIICAKNRNGKVFKVPLRFISEHSNFVNWTTTEKYANESNSDSDSEKKGKRRGRNTDTWTEVIAAKGGDNDAPF